MPVCVETFQHPHAAKASAKHATYMENHDTKEATACQSEKFGKLCKKCHLPINRTRKSKDVKRKSRKVKNQKILVFYGSFEKENEN